MSLPVQPLTDALEARATALANSRYGCPMGLEPLLGKDLARSFRRAKARGSLTVPLVDRICCRVLRVHPVTVYQDWYR